MRLKHANPSAAGSAAPIASMRAIAPGTEVTGASGAAGASGASGRSWVGRPTDMAVTIRSPGSQPLSLTPSATWPGALRSAAVCWRNAGSVARVLCLLRVAGGRPGLGFVRQPHHAQRRQRQLGGMVEIVPADRLGRDVPDRHVATAELRAVGVEDLHPAPGPGEPDTVALPGHRGEVCHAGDGAPRRHREPEERQNAVVGVVRVDPAEAGPLEVLLPQRRLLAV